MDIEDVKLYLRIDGTEEDALISRFMDAAEAYLAGAVTGYERLYDSDETFAKAADQAKLAIIADLYEHRVNDAAAADFSYTVRSLINQLSCWG